MYVVSANYYYVIFVIAYSAGEVGAVLVVLWLLPLVVDLNKEGIDVMIDRDSNICSDSLICGGD